MRTDDRSVRYCYSMIDLAIEIAQRMGLRTSAISTSFLIYTFRELPTMYSKVNSGDDHVPTAIENGKEC